MKKNKWRILPRKFWKSINAAATGQAKYLESLLYLLVWLLVVVFDFGSLLSVQLSFIWLEKYNFWSSEQRPD